MPKLEKLYYATLNDQKCTIVAATSLEAARLILRLDVGYGFDLKLREATDEDVAWVRDQGGDDFTNFHVE